MRELKRQLAGALIVILTVAAVLAAAINFQQRKKFHLPEDGVIWTQTRDGVTAGYVTAGGPAARAGIRSGDQVRSIQRLPVATPSSIPEILANLKPWTEAAYVISRNGIEAPAKVILAESATGAPVYYLYAVGVAYLLIGLLVYFRRSTAPKAEHFYILCLASFVFGCFHPTWKLNNFDKIIYLGNVAAGLFAPTIFLHFCLTFPEPWPSLRPRYRQALLYIPASLILLVTLGFENGFITTDVSAVDVRWLLDRAWILSICTAYLLGAVALTVAYRSAGDPVVRQQLRWLRNGSVLGVLPFTAIYAVPFVLGRIPSEMMELSVLSLGIVPLTWAYAIVRYRLLEVDVIFEQGYLYTLATVVVLGTFYGLLITLNGVGELNPTTVISLILIATFLFLPVRNWMQEQLERNFLYKDHYDHRRTIITFARELSAETDVDKLLRALAERLRQTLSIRHLAFFLPDEREGRFFLKLRAGAENSDEPLPPGTLDLSFLPASPDKPYLFFEHTRNLVDIVSRRWPGSVRRTVSELDLTYYLPCAVRGKVIAYIGLSRTTKNDFLSSDDMELLLTLTGYVGIAVENTRLYHSLQRKAEEFERLKEFSENIVESINVGVLAADLDDNVESWNSQMHRLTGVPPDHAIGKPLRALFPPELCAKFDEVRGLAEIQNIYKFVMKSAPEGSLTAIANGNGNGNGHHGNSNGNGSSSPATERTVNLAIGPLISRDNEQIGRLIIIDDVTNQAELERQLVQADKLSSIGLLAAGVAHEVNTPLAVISTYAQMLGKQVTGDDPKSALLEKIAKQTFRASEIVNSLLNFSRTAPTQFGPVDLNRTLRETVNLVQHQLEKNGITVELELGTDLPMIRGNSGKLQQVFLNLLLNARDAMERGGRLTVRSWSSGANDLVEVHDTGSGISAENLARVFDPFFTTKGAKKGTGLGLAVSYGIVQEHGGSISVDSTPGNGTRFRLEFPLAAKPVNV